MEKKKKSYDGKKSASGCPSLGVGDLTRSGRGKGESRRVWNLLQEPVSGHSHPVDTLQDVVPTIHPRGHRSRSSRLWETLSKPAETISPRSLARGLSWLLLHMCRVANLNLLPRIFQRFFSPFFLISSSVASRAPGKVTADSLS